MQIRTFWEQGNADRRREGCCLILKGRNVIAVVRDKELVGFPGFRQIGEVRAEVCYGED